MSRIVHFWDGVWSRDYCVGEVATRPECRIMCVPRSKFESYKHKLTRNVSEVTCKLCCKEIGIKPQGADEQKRRWAEAVIENCIVQGTHGTWCRNCVQAACGMGRIEHRDGCVVAEAEEYLKGTKEAE